MNLIQWTNKLKNLINKKLLGTRSAYKVWFHRSSFYNVKISQIAGMFFQTRSRACLKKAFCKMCVTICGRFCPDEGAVAGYGN